MMKHMDSETSRRRKKLLEETRRLYQEQNKNPAIHPRYQALHKSLYDQEYTPQNNSLKLRILLSILCFVCYMILDYGNIGIAHFDSNIIHENIRYQMQLYEISEVLNNYEQTGTFR